MKLSERQELVSRLPWVRRLTTSPGRCEGYRASHMPLKAWFQMGDRPPDLVLREKYRCKRAAWWRFRALRRSGARDGDYCWTHLIVSGLQANEMEDKRAGRKLDELGWPAAPSSKEAVDA
jgi:hypothetical protein